MNTPILILPILLMFGLFSCNQIDPAPLPGDDPNSRMTKLDYIVMHQVWEVSFFWNAGEEATESLSGYAFKFHGNHNFSAFDGESTIKGYWNTTIGPEGPVLKIDVSYPDAFGMLTRHWNIMGDPYQENMALKLQDVHTSKRDSYFLTFIPYQ